MTQYSKLNSKQIEKWINFLIARDGDYCQGCKTALYLLPQKIHIDHIDHDSTNNPENGTNYQLLCNSCNAKKGWYKDRLGKQMQIEDRPYTPEMRKNLSAEPKWVNWMINELTERHSVCHGEAINNGASVVNVSPETIKRYLKKRLGVDGLFDIGFGKCGSILCDETHVYFKGSAPTME